MIPRIRKVLYATDLSENSAYAFRYAINTAEKHNAKIVILHVIDELSPNIRIALDTIMTDRKRESLRKQAIEVIEARLRVICEKELAGRPECMDMIDSVMVLEGYPAEEILKQADRLNCDVIIMGTHGKGWATHAFLGSVAERVLRRTRKPVFIIPLPGEETDITFKV